MLDPSDRSIGYLVRRARLQALSLVPLGLLAAGHIVKYFLDSQALLWALVCLQLIVAAYSCLQLIRVDLPWLRFMRAELGNRVPVPFPAWSILPLFIPTLTAPFFAWTLPPFLPLLTTASLVAIFLIVAALHVNTKPMLEAHARLLQRSFSSRFAA